MSLPEEYARPREATLGLEPGSPSSNTVHFPALEAEPVVEDDLSRPVSTSKKNLRWLARKNGLREKEAVRKS